MQNENWGNTSGYLPSPRIGQESVNKYGKCLEVWKIRILLKLHAPAESVIIRIQLPSSITYDRSSDLCSSLIS